MAWATFSSVPKVSRAALHVSNSTLNIWLLEGPIAYLTITPLASALLIAPRGLQRATRLAGVGVCVACALRLLPFAFSAATREQHHAALLVPIFVAQGLNALCAPFTQNAPALLSAMWFEAHQRNMVTGVANASNAAGRAIGFFLGPALAATAGQLPRLLLVELALAVLPLLGVLLYFPSQPAAPPSVSAARGGLVVAVSGGGGATAGRPADRAHNVNSGFGASSTINRDDEETTIIRDDDEETNGGGPPASTGTSNLLRRTREALGVPSVALLVAIYGIEMGAYCSWSGVLPTICEGQFSASRSGLLASLNTVGSIFGGFLLGWLSDKPPLCFRLKGAMMVLLLGAAIEFALLGLAFTPYSVFGPLPYAIVVYVATLAGIFRGGLDPLFFELASEISYPASPGLLGSLITVACHMVMILFLSVPADILNRWASTALAVIMLAALVAMAFVRERYPRRSLDLR